MLMRVAPGLLQEDGLIDSGILQGAKVTDHILRRSIPELRGASPAAAATQLIASLAASGQILPTDSYGGHGVVGDERIERVAEKFESFLSAADRFRGARGANENDETIAMFAFTVCPSGTH